MKLLLLALLAYAAPESLYSLAPLKPYDGKVTLIVNTASKCGYTPQYKALQALHEKYQGQGFSVLGFPSNDFMGQEPGMDAEIKKFCELNYGVKFPLFKKAPVKGEATQPVFKLLKAGTGGEEVPWNFTKFLVDRKGRVVQRFAPKVKPDDAELTSRLEELLKAR